MKLSFTSIAISLAIIMQPVHADLISDSEEIMNDAQQVYRQYFPSNQTTQIFDPFRYRFYPSTGIYLGINQIDEGVYLLGGPFGELPYYVDQKANVIALLKSQMGGNSSQNEVCDTSDIPTGFTYRQVDNTTYVTTNGQCIVLPENRNVCDPLPEIDASGLIIATGIHVLSQTIVSNFEISGLDFPGFDSILQEAAKQKTCIINAPTVYTNHTVHTDICIDITNQLGDLSALPGVSPPVTTHFTGVSDSTRVNDCFATDAAVITDLVSEKVWLKENGSFIEVN